MRLRFLTAILLVATLSFGSVNVVPTTTLSAETSNNTSNPLTSALSNGNIKGSNISKVDSASLLYTGASTQILAHYMPWWDNNGHIRIANYDEHNPAVVHAQIDDMLSRGITGMIVDWYAARGTFNNTTTKLVRDDANTRTNFGFMLCYDGGALKSSTNPTQTLISDLNYANTNYFSSSAYIRSGGRPLVQFFSVDNYAIDWAKVRAGVQGNPKFIFRNSGSFSKSYSDGGFAWIGVGTSAGMGYLQDFYWNANQHPTKVAFGGVYKGFDDTIASWGSNRHTPQHCGKTWLDTWATIRAKIWDSSNQLDFVELNTWNDYEEGTALETGIDNCVSSVSLAIASQTLTFQPHFSDATWGSKMTIDHYNVFVSKDGETLMPLFDLADDVESVDLSKMDWMPGTYIFYVKAVGKPGITNHMSNAVSMTVAPPPRVVTFHGLVDGAVVGTTFTVTGDATSPTMDITYMKIWFDGKAVATSNTTSISTTITTTVGKHRITLQANDGAGVYSKTINVTVK